MTHTATRLARPTSKPSGRLGQLSEDQEPLFVYGSLRFPEVLLALLDRVPANAPAQAQGWRVAALADYVYPALVPAPGTANGILLLGLTTQEWHVLDAFENEIYQLHCLSLDNNRSGWAYVCHSFVGVLPQDWDAKHFAEHELDSYVERCRIWRQRHESVRTDLGQAGSR
ncbi:gamma-glutamylcyclotransferase family protein [Actinokineospora iranica]|uniref:Putative gamma-glutamylcyclotransferase n=1 Tax=Actinokineospora iranica TaxID=1271860 RepID=A0A1G6K8G0_9PSEU|nr:Gamma-glutamyl cyclotransferase, AIG2-like [Actinokineospora iranica]